MKDFSLGGVQYRVIFRQAKSDTREHTGFSNGKTGNDAFQNARKLVQHQAFSMRNNSLIIID
jgi:transposase